MMRVLDLFSGIGGFSLGLERTGGFRTVAFCEIEPFCRRVLHKHWPQVPCYHDVRELTAERLRADGIAVDVICGGFPCQDISFAGKGAGLVGERSGLWSEYARIIGEVRPSYVIVENVSALLSRGLDTVLGDLASLGFDAEWHCIPASAIGAPHRRDRVWILAYRNSQSVRDEGLPTSFCPPSGSEEAEQEREWIRVDISSVSAASGVLADAQGSRQSACLLGPWQIESGRSNCGDSWWLSEPDVGRVAHGVPQRVDRLKSLGNAVVPQIPELIGNAILASLKQGAAA